MDRPELNDDFLDILRAFLDAEVAFVVVGAHALAAHGVLRATGDLDVLVEPTAENARRVVAALRAFGAPLEAHGVTAGDFVRPENVYHIGLPPRRIDVLTSITGVTYEEAQSTSLEVDLAMVKVRVLGRDMLLQNKRATGRTKDLADVEALERPRR